MKIQLFDEREKGVFPIYPYTSDVNYPQNKVRRTEGYEDNQVFIVSAGRGRIEIGGECYELEKNDMFYIAASVPHEYYGINEEFCTGYLSFNGDGVKGIEKYYGLSGYGIFKGKSKGAFEEELSGIFGIMDSGREASVLCVAAYSAVIAFFNEAFRKERSIPEKVYSYLEKNYASPVTLSDILTLSPWSKTKLAEEFKREYGMTIFEALGKIRLLHTRRMLKENSSFKLKEVSEKCGFSDVSYFCRMYKRFFGNTPGAERN